MNDLIHIGTRELARFLKTNLPQLSKDWWEQRVVERLSFQQQRMVLERRLGNLQQLDFAALLRVLDQNWNELTDVLGLPREGRTWVKELQTVRNKWAHLPSASIPAGDLYRDADTLSRVLTMLGSERLSIEAVESVKARAVTNMANSTKLSSPDATPAPTQSAQGAEQTHPPGIGQTSDLEPGGPLFSVGDLIALRSNPTELMPIIEVLSGGAEYRYRVYHNNTPSIYYESQLQRRQTESKKLLTLTAEELRARLTSLQILSPSTANLFSLRSGRVQFVPYQYRPVLRLIRADRPRLLLADEVGVGKTIEAGLIIKELQARMEISSVLVICPKALVAERKWLNEMKRFDEHFTALDGPLLRHCLNETYLNQEWPDQYAKAILPFSLFDSDLLLGSNRRRGRNDQGLLKLDPPPRFDLVIVDEAHHIRNSETFLHQGVRYFCDNSQAVLFLTATPVQLGSDDLYTLLNVLRPDLIIDHASFEQMAEPNRYINTAVQHCRAARHGWQLDARTCLDSAAQTQWGQLFLRESPAFQQAYDQLHEESINDHDRVGIIHTVEQLYTFSALINRTRRRDIGEFTTRKPETITVEFTSAQKQLHDGLLDVVARILAICHGNQNVKFMMTTIRRQAASCLYGLAPLLEDILTGKLDRLELMEASDGDIDIDLGFVDKVRLDVENLLEQARHLDPTDPKVDSFVRVLVDKRARDNNKALVFSTFRHTLSYLATHTERTDMRYGVVHGDVPDEERAEIRRRFALPREDPDAIDVMLSSEVGCEGLDFQCCDLLINYDLPWNPMRIEQRIGRIDRYGQKSETVAIANFVVPGTVDADIYNRCLWRIGVFHHAVGGSEEILGQITSELHDIAESFDLTSAERDERLRQLADNGVRQIREEQELESKQSELFGLNVPSQWWREEIEAAETFWLSADSIQTCIATYLSSRLNSDTQHILGDKPLKTLRLGQEARNQLLEDYRRLPRSNDPTARNWERWLKGGAPTLSVTFDQETASFNPGVVHLTVLHPLVRQAAHFLDIGEPAYVVLKTRSERLADGEYDFALYRWRKKGARPDEMLVPVAADPTVETEILTAIESAVETEHLDPPDVSAYDPLDVRHHSKWAAARANHIDETRQLLERRTQSVTVSHRARCRILEDQLGRATNQKIRLMKESELARANADFDRRVGEIRRAADSADILADPVVFGRIKVGRL